LPRKILGQVVARTALLRELLVPVPRERMFTNKKLVNIEAADDGTVTISFKDGSKDTVDAVIGADGIHGYVREYILGADHPARSASFAGWWDCRALVPVAKAREILGEEYFDEPRQYAWCGNGGFLMHDVLDSGDTVQCVASVMKDNWDLTDWSRELDEAKLEEAFGGWTNSPIAKGMIKVSY
jgi:salicylate hydroxylase